MGYSADVEVMLAVRDGVVRRADVGVVGGGPRCWWSSADRHAAERKIKTGLSNWEFAEVVSGVDAGDKVVTSLEREGVAPACAWWWTRAAGRRDMSNPPSRRFGSPARLR